MKILVCEDHALFREGLRHVLAPLARELVCLEADDPHAAFAHVAEHSDMDVVLLGMALGDTDGLAVLRECKQRRPELPVAMVSQRERLADVADALRAGAAGFIPKSSTGAVLRAAIGLILSGGIYVPPFAISEPDGRLRSRIRPRSHRGHLSERQLYVARLAARGLTNGEIAQVLGIREPTVKTHLVAVFSSLDVTNRAEIGMVLRSMGLDLD